VKVFEYTRDHMDELLKILEDARSRGELPEYLEKPFADLVERFGNGERGP